MFGLPCADIPENRCYACTVVRRQSLFDLCNSPIPISRLKNYGRAFFKCARVCVLVLKSEPHFFSLCAVAGKKDNISGKGKESHVHLLYAYNKVGKKDGAAADVLIAAGD